MKIINKKALKEFKIMAYLAINHTDSIIESEMYWNAAMLSLQEACGK